MKNLIVLCSFLSIVLAAHESFAQFDGRDHGREGRGPGSPSAGPGMNNPPGRPSPSPRPGGPGPQPQPVRPQPPPQQPQPQPPGNNYGDMVTIYRMYNGVDHMLTTNPNEGVQVRYHFEQEAMRLYRSGGRDRVAIYRCVVRQDNDHFESTQDRCEGQLTEGLLGYAQSFQSSNAPRAIYRCVVAKDHLTTLDMNECIRANYKVEGILGYVP